MTIHFQLLIRINLKYTIILKAVCICFLCNTLLSPPFIANLDEKEHFLPKSFCNIRVNRIFVYNFGVVMTEEEKKLLNSFETQLRHLIYLHDELKRENAELKKLLENEKLKNEKVQAQYDELEVSYTNLKTATAISLNGSDVKETKLRLSKLVREVDKCIALLNE